MKADRRSKLPYVLGLKRLPLFGPESDLEPNDDARTAGTIPPSLHLAGQASGDDFDWYRLPDLERPAVLTVTSALDEPPELRFRVGHLVLEDFPSGPQKRTIDDDDGELKKSEDGKSFVLELPAGHDRFLRVSAGGVRHYDVTLGFSDGPVAVAPSRDLSVALSTAANAAAAFSEVNQKIGATLTVQNSGSAAVEAALGVRLSDDRWSVEGLPATVQVAAGANAEVKFALIAPPLLFDGGKLIVAAEATAGAAQGSAEATVGFSMDAAAVAPERRWELPDSMLGGINVAWSALGGTTPESSAGLIDGFATSGTAERIDASDDPAEIAVIDLAGDAPVTLTGVTINPTIGPDLNNQVRRVAIETSLDGQGFTRVFEGEIGARQREYALPFAAPVEAKFIKVLPLEVQGLAYSVAIIGEVKAIALPATAALLAPQGFDIADPKLGGFVANYTPTNVRADKMLFGEDQPDSAHFGTDDARVFNWTVSFRNQRAARLARIEWQDGEKTDPKETIASVTVETATAANGPFTAAGTWEIVRAGDGSVAPFTFAAPVWARYVRFTPVLPPYDEAVHSNYYQLPKKLSIFEAPADAANGSIVGEWGEAAREGPYEKLNPPPLPQGVAAVAAGGATKVEARALPLDQPLAGRASAGTRAEWWAVEVPADGQSLTLTLAGQPGLAVVAALEDASGKTVPLAIETDDGQTRTATAKVSAGRYYVKVEEPPRSIAVAWDTSGSVGPYVPTIIQSIRGFARFLTPGRDEVSLIPFDEPDSKPILDEWTGDPLTAFAALNSYDWSDQSSDAESGVIGAARALDGRPGTRAIILITDYATNATPDERALSYALLQKTRARVFNFAIPSGSDAKGAATERGLMMTYAGLSNGTATYAGTPAELEQAFARTAAALRAPKDYTIAAAVGFKPPEPGFVQVTVKETEAAPPAPKDRAVLVILDASGSMLKKLGKKRRIDIAKETLNELTQKMLPAGTLFALRVFGDTKPDSCETNLRLPMAPLDQAAAKGVVDKITSVNKAKTAIGASLALAGEDLAGAAGQKLIILITDGEETCDGDPRAAIDALRAEGIDARISIVGFAVDDQALKDTFAEWATAGGGGYFDATKPGDLAPAVRRALLPAYEVVAADGTVVAKGIAGGEKLEVPPGTYTIRVLSDPPQEFPGIVIESGGTAEVALGQ